jgi:peptidoglycan hydrolase-like protein with peptidoglycan-binding domain
MHVDLNNPNAVLWLQQSLLRVVQGYVYLVTNGEFDALTRKAVHNFQEQNGLPLTSEPDTETVARIEQELAVLDAQPYKKKQRLPLPKGKPGDPVKI